MVIFVLSMDGMAGPVRVHVARSAVADVRNARVVTSPAAYVVVYVQCMHSIDALRVVRSSRVDPAATHTSPKMPVSARSLSRFPTRPLPPVCF